MENLWINGYEFAIFTAAQLSFFVAACLACGILDYFKIANKEYIEYWADIVFMAWGRQFAILLIAAALLLVGGCS